MDQVRVHKDELTEIVKENREKHRELFEQAVEGYRKRAEEILVEHIERIQAGKVEQVRVSLPAPEDHTEDYDRVLRMLDMSIDDEISLEAHDFQRYVMDDWSWKREWLAATAVYTDMAE